MLRFPLALTLLLTVAACSSAPEPTPGPDTIEASVAPTVGAEAGEMNTLGAGDDVAIERVFTQFVEAVRAGDAAHVAEFIRFPLTLDDGTEVDRAAFLSAFYPDHMGQPDGSFRQVILNGSADDLEAFDDGRYYFMALDRGGCEEDPECSGAAMIFYFAPEGDSWVIDEIQFAG